MRLSGIHSGKINQTVIYGFIFISLVFAVTVAFTYRNLTNTQNSFRVLDDSVSKEIVSLSDIRASYSRMLLEMTTFLLLDFRGEEARSQIEIINDLKSNFLSSLQKLSGYYTDIQKPADIMELEESGRKSTYLIEEIVRMRVEGAELDEILIVKKKLKDIEEKRFFPLLESMLESNIEKIAKERTFVDLISRNSLALLWIFGVLGVGSSVFIGLFVSYRERASDRFREQLISIASHQLKAPITAVKGNLELLTDAGLPADKRCIAEDLEDAAEDLAVTVENLLDLSRIDEGGFRLDPKKINLAAVLGHAISDLRFAAEKRGIRINAIDLDKEWEVFADEARISQVFKNVVDNAVKYSQDKGVIDVLLKDSGKNVQVAVADSGIGILPSEQKKIFGRFFRASNTAGRKSGSGLGLFIVKEIVEQSGGKIWFESKPGQGTTFFIELPKGV
jgi:signal transduction histidine kinase